MKNKQVARAGGRAGAGLQAIGGAAYMAAAIALRPLFMPRLRRWGATSAEVGRRLPGDDLVSQSRAGYTQAITVHAPVTAVWPWLVQIGQGRGGFYSYEALENLVGCDIHNATAIRPELQDLKAGDGVRLHPNVPALPAALMEPERAIVLYGSEPIGQKPDRDTKAPGYFATTWLFYTEGVAGGGTRLITRYRLGYTPRFGNDLVYRGLVEPISAVMQRKMLLGIKALAEAAHAGLRAEPEQETAT
jgi:hypothetical protein